MALIYQIGTDTVNSIELTALKLHSGMLQMTPEGQTLFL